MLTAIFFMIVAAIVVEATRVAEAKEDPGSKSLLSAEWYGTWQRADGKKTLKISATKIEVSRIVETSGEAPVPVSYVYSWTTANAANVANPYTFGYAATPLSTDQLRKRFQEALDRQDEIFSVTAPEKARELLETLSPGLHEKLWAYSEGDFDIGYMLIGDKIVEVQDTMYAFALDEFTRVSGNIAAGSDGTSESESSTAKSLVEMEDGSILAGGLLGGKVVLKSSLGKISVSMDDVVGFAEGKLQLQDGTILKGAFVDGEVEVASSLGTLKIPSSNVVRIVREGNEALSDQTQPQPAAPQPAAGQGVLTGRVIDNFKAPIRGATIRIQGSAFETTTDSNGRYRLPYVPGALVIQMSHQGYDRMALT